MRDQTRMHQGHHAPLHAEMRAQMRRLVLAEGLPIERGLKWGVSPSVRVVMSDGSSELVHDDRLLSAALVAELDRLIREGEVFVTTGECGDCSSGDGREAMGVIVALLVGYIVVMGLVAGLAVFVVLGWVANIK